MSDVDVKEVSSDTSVILDFLVNLSNEVRNAHASVIRMSHKSDVLKRSIDELSDAVKALQVESEENDKISVTTHVRIVREVINQCMEVEEECDEPLDDDTWISLDDEVVDTGECEGKEGAK